MRTRAEELEDQIKILTEERRRLQETYEAIMAGAWTGDEHSVEARALALDSKIDQLQTERDSIA